ncbi:MAG TPA: hypothetical protein VGM98_11180, partial [Schlesneria sp.]
MESTNWQTTHKDFISSEREFEKESRARFLALAIQLELNEEIASEDIGLIIDEAKMTVDDLLKTTGVAREILQLITVIEDEIADGPQLADHERQIRQQWAVMRDNEQYIRGLIVEHEVNRKRLHGADRQRHLTSARLRERATDAVRRLAELDATAFGVSVPERNRSGPPIAHTTSETGATGNVKWVDARTEGIISRRFDLARSTRIADVAPQIEKLGTRPAEQNAANPTEDVVAQYKIVQNESDSGPVAHQQTNCNEPVVELHDETPADEQTAVVDSEP